MKTLLLIDWQNTDYRNSDRPHNDVAVGKGLCLLDAWRSKELNIVHVFLDSVKFFQSNKWRRQRFKSESPIVDNSILQQFLPLVGETVIWKSDRSAFYDTNLHDLLLEGQEVYCTGAATTGCILATAIHGDALGYQMNFVSDCIFDRNHQRHEKGVDILSKFGKIVNSNDIL